MKFKISVRQLSSNDASKDCPFPDIDDDLYDLHLKTLVDDICNLPDVINAFISNNEITIESILDKQTLKNSIKQIFSREFCYVRFIDIEEIPI